MNLVIAKQSKRPDWKHWKRLGSVKLKDAILLSLDICPIWYENYIIDNYQRADNPVYPSRLSQSEVNSLLNVLNYTESEYSIRLQVVQSWAFKQDWFIEKKDFTSKDINENMLVDLKKFFHASFNQMDFNNDYDEIPLDLKGMQASKGVVIQRLPQNDWVIKAQKFGEEYLKKNPKITLDELSQLVFERFIIENIQTAHGGGRNVSLSSIKTTAFSKSGWFRERKHYHKSS
jgi:hypothetical protein